MMVYAQKFDKRNYCAVAFNCLQEKPRMCNDSLSKPIEDVKYNDEYCGGVKDIQLRGIPLQSFWGKRVYSEFGKEYRVEYLIQGTLPVSFDMMYYLEHNIPFAAHLINAYQDTEYTAEYISDDKSRFKGNNGGSLEGNMKRVLADSTGAHTTYFGNGNAKFLWWKLWGIALMLLDYETIDKNNIRFSLKVVVFNESSMVNGIMNMGIFRSVVKSKLNDVIEHISGAAEEFAKGNLKPLKENKALQSKENQLFLAEFKKVIEQSGYQLKVK